jgi:acetyl-CoA carboxylase biotin carboxyl carrier protein
MRFKKILRLIKIVEESQINELEISGWGQHVRITKNASHRRHLIELPDTQQSYVSRAVQWWDGSSISSIVSLTAQEQKLRQEEDDRGWIEIRSPMVGTFYRTSAPEQPPYVEVGEIIAPGQVVCLIEAMKLMNEIQAEVGGRVVEIAVENGHAVEYNQVLFRLRKQ